MDSARPSPRIEVRLQKYLADCGLGSRRFCETLIQAGRVQVNGSVVSELGTRVDPESDLVLFDGKPLASEARFLLMLHKPARVVCSSNDTEGRMTVLDLIQPAPARLYTVGRLDFMSEGLILLTNEGDLAHRLTHPRYHLEKEYRLELSRYLSQEEMRQLQQGVVHDGDTLKLRRILLERPGRPVYRLVLTQGKNRQIRRMCEVLDVQVMRLMRIRVGPLELGMLPPRKFRALTDAERTALYQAAGLSQEAPCLLPEVAPSDTFAE